MNQLLDQNLTQIGITDDGAEIVLSFEDAGPSAIKRMFRCRDVIAVKWHRTSSDSTPYIIPEVSWDRLSGDRIPTALEEHGYSFSRWGSAFLQPFEEFLIRVKLEGSVCMEIICGDMEIQAGQTHLN